MATAPIFGEQPLILQPEIAARGLVFLTIIVFHHGVRTDLPFLRERFAVSLIGTSFDNLAVFGNRLKLSAGLYQRELE